ncbi:hypothetical protein KC19_1G068200 [Ceratodon purpureus]|uniref:Uncharacterized protein n=1 Tax=Ceratodon purpureus TaxID=3225 RepID=A0A8T0J575_CERPU|nr:hypothetical protein KC19_1G068200 [Ceratodon purpureus]
MKRSKRASAPKKPSTNSTRSSPSTTTNTLETFSVASPSESMLWAPALAAADHGSTSSFRLPELSVPPSAHTGYVAHSDFQEDQIIFGNFEPHMLYDQYLMERPSEPERVEVPLVQHPFYANHGPPASGMPYEPFTDSVSDHINAADGVTLVPTEDQVPPYFPPPYLPWSDASEDDQIPGLHDPSWAPLLQALLAPSSPSHNVLGVVLSPQYEPHSPELVYSTAQAFGVMPCYPDEEVGVIMPFYPDEDGTTENTVVPHCEEISMPTIGNVQGFMRIGNTLYPFPDTARSAPPPPLTVEPYWCPPTTSTWERTSLAVNYAIDCQESQATFEHFDIPAPIIQPTPMEQDHYAHQTRPSTMAQDVLENSANKPPLNKNKKLRSARRNTTKEPQGTKVRY